MGFIPAFIKGQLGYIGAHAIVIFLFLFYYIIIPDYWFLCTFFTIIIWGGVSIYLSIKKERSGG